jgi:hypothetical protein
MPSHVARHALDAGHHQGAEGECQDRGDEQLLALRERPVVAGDVPERGDEGAHHGGEVEGHPGQEDEGEAHVHQEAEQRVERTAHPDVVPARAGHGDGEVQVDQPGAEHQGRGDQERDDHIGARPELWGEAHHLGDTDRDEHGGEDEVKRVEGRQLAHKARRVAHEGLSHHAPAARDR